MRHGIIHSLFLPSSPGDHDRRVDEREQVIQVDRIIVHEQYMNMKFNNDIALLQLEKPIMFGAHVQPVCLPHQGETPQVGSKCYITGEYAY